MVAIRKRVPSPSIFAEPANVESPAAPSEPPIAPLPRSHGAVRRGSKRLGIGLAGGAVLLAAAGGFMASQGYFDTAGTEGVPMKDDTAAPQPTKDQPASAEERGALEETAREALFEDEHAPADTTTPGAVGGPTLIPRVVGPGGTIVPGGLNDATRTAPGTDIGRLERGPLELGVRNR